MRNLATRLLPLAAALLAPVVAAEPILGAPSFDNVLETTYRRVSWEDFRGSGRQPPGFNRWRKGSFALIATSLRMSRHRVEDRREESGWVAWAVGIRPYAVMNKDFSAVRHGSRNARTLAHEQLHFDLAETMARRLAVRLAAVEGRGGSPEEARADLARRLREGFEAGVRELQELQARYDGETANGQRKKPQKRWAEKVPELFREATEALAAMLEEAGGEPG